MKNEDIVENVFNQNSDDGYDFETIDMVTEPSVIQQVNRSLDLVLENNKVYNAKFSGTKVFSSEPNKEKIGLSFEVFDGNISKEEYINLFFYSNNRKCIEISLLKLKKFTKMLGIELNQEDLKDLYSIKNALESLVGTHVKVKYTVRYDDKSERNYPNIEVVEVLNEDYENGGNL